MKIRRESFYLLASIAFGVLVVLPALVVAVNFSRYQKYFLPVATRQILASERRLFDLCFVDGDLRGWLVLLLPYFVFQFGRLVIQLRRTPPRR